MRRAPGPLGWLIVLEALGAGDYRLPWWRWWRRNVHPWTDVPSATGAATGGKGAPIVAGMTFVCERESGAWIDCVPCSGAMIAGWAEREPSPHLNDAHRIREGAGLPHSGGMTDYQLAQGLEEVYSTAGSTIAATKAAILEALDDGRGVTWFHTYGRLPSDLRRWSPSFTGGHCAAIVGRKSPTSELVGWWDPLATEGWTGEWVDLDVLLAADWGDPARSYQRKSSSGSSGGGGGDVGIRYNLERWKIAEGTPFYDAPKGAKIGSYSSATTTTTMGPALTSSDPDGVNYGWRAALVRSGALDGTTGPKVVWIERPADSAIVASPPGWDEDVWTFLTADPTNWVTPVPPGGEPPPSSGGSYEDGYNAGAADEWEEWRTGLGIPAPPPGA